MTGDRARDLVFIGGYLMVAIGLAAWDWRVALLINGCILMLLAVIGTWRGNGRGRV